MQKEPHEIPWIKWPLIAAVGWLVGHASCNISWGGGETIRIVYTLVMIGIFVYLASRQFYFSLIFFGAMSTLLLFGQSVLAIAERYGSEASVIFLCSSLFFGGFIWWYLDNQKLRCEKCGYPLEDKHLLDEETVSLYRCPKCNHITRYQFKGKYTKVFEEQRTDFTDDEDSK